MEIQEQNHNQQNEGKRAYIDLRGYWKLKQTSAKLMLSQMAEKFRKL